MESRFKLKINAPVVIVFVAICLVAMVLNLISHGATNDLLFKTWHSSLNKPMTYVRFVTYIFGHNDWNHLISNTAYILLLGAVLEDRYGSFRLLAGIVVSAVVASVINYILFPHTALCGASGIVFFLIVLMAFSVGHTGEIPVTTILVVAIFVIWQIHDWVGASDNISYMTLLAGAGVGFLFGALWEPNG